MSVRKLSFLPYLLTSSINHMTTWLISLVYKHVCLRNEIRCRCDSTALRRHLIRRSDCGNVYIEQKCLASFPDLNAKQFIRLYKKSGFKTHAHISIQTAYLQQFIITNKSKFSYHNQLVRWSIANERWNITKM